LAKHLAENFGVKVTGVTIAEAGYKYSRDLCSGLPVENLLMDYRSLNSTLKFDRIVSVEMFEHVGPAQHQTYFQTVDRYLKDHGMFLLQISYTPHSYVPQCDMGDRIAFKNIWFPYIMEIWRAAENLFILDDFHSLNGHTEKTFSAMAVKIEQNKTFLMTKVGSEDYFKGFFMTQMVLGAMRSKAFDTCQIVFSKAGLKPPYQSER